MTRRGGSAVEMAFLTPVLLALVMGMIEAARLGMVCQLLTTAAREVEMIAAHAKMPAHHPAKGIHARDPAT